MPIRKKSTKKTGKKPPKASLRAGLKKKLQGARKVALLAVGSSLRGDDAAGLLVAEHLKTLPRLKKDTLKIFMGETAPENLTGEIKRYLPTHLIVIDSAEIGARAGEISLIEPRGGRAADLPAWPARYAVGRTSPEARGERCGREEDGQRRQVCRVRWA